MLSHLSSKFSLGDEQQTHEPRAALFLNRFTRSLTIMYATSGIEQIIGVSSESMKGRSFYYCIQENCLDDAVRVLESAKGNDSIAYLRFRFRDPRRDDPPESTPSESEDEIMTDITSDDEFDDDDGDSDRRPSTNGSRDGSASRTSSSSSVGDDSPWSREEEDIELEAVVSCTSDGLVVCLRRARPMLPTAALHMADPTHHGSIFAAPWAPDPIFRPAPPHLPPFPLGAQHPAMRQAGPPPDFMQTIRDVAVFAWALTGINGCLAEFAHGTPVGDCLPAEGFPVWDPPAHLEPKHSFASSGYGSGNSSHSSIDPFGDPGLD
jgi:hypothetical protein